eukprot:gb/GECH01001659.1/.p1 GENE.gb/GECH01001659.1/~~gb/GECH01001659.1/.p1  ORF type:complete len:582 (+),score=73.80 gb/GECH01001659.1/:1-1746(+)
MSPSTSFKRHHSPSVSSQDTPSDNENVRSPRIPPRKRQRSQVTPRATSSDHAANKPVSRKRPSRESQSHIYAHSIPPPPPSSSLQTRKFCVTIDEEDKAKQRKLPLYSQSSESPSFTCNNNNTGNQKHSTHLDPIRMPLSQFTEEQYNKLIVNGDVPVVLSATEECQQIGKWTPQPQVSPTSPTQGRNQGRGPLQHVRVPVRYQAVDETDDRRYCPLHDEEKTLEWVLQRKGVSTASEDPCYDYREGLETVMYVKDWDFSDSHPHWYRQLKRLLPKFLWWQGIKDAHAYLPKQSRVRNLVAYLGFQNSRTPLHVDKVYNTAVNVAVHGEGYKEWRVIDRGSLEVLQEALRQVGGSIFAEDFWLSSAFLDALPIKQYVFRQYRHDIVLIPPDLPHQVMNGGDRGYLLALAYNILHPMHLKDALQVDWVNQKHAYPSLYRVKAMVYHGAKEECKRLKGKTEMPPGLTFEDCTQHLRLAIKSMLPILSEEKKVNKMLPAHTTIYTDEDPVPYSRSCDLCRADLFNSRYSCLECDQDGYDLCPQCYHGYENVHEHPLFFFQRYKFNILHALLRHASSTLQAIKEM